MTIEDLSEWGINKLPAFIGKNCMNNPEKAATLISMGKELTTLFEKHSTNFKTCGNMAKWDLATVQGFMEAVFEIDKRIGELYRFLR